jgi:hypothetical protein
LSDNDFALNFACPVNTLAGETSCAKVLDIQLDVSKITETIEPVIAEFVNPEAKDGYLDEIVTPLLPLDESIEPLIALTGQEWTVSCKPSCCSKRACFETFV